MKKLRDLTEPEKKVVTKYMLEIQSLEQRVAKLREIMADFAFAISGGQEGIVMDSESIYRKEEKNGA